MWRRLLLVTGLAAVAAYFLKRHRSSATPAAIEADPAEELRRKLDDARSNEAEPETAPTPDLDARRRDVHERARAAVDEMQSSSDGE